jgi:hypothetical protein
MIKIILIGIIILWGILQLIIAIIDYRVYIKNAKANAEVAKTNIDRLERFYSYPYNPKDAPNNPDKIYILGNTKKFEIIAETIPEFRAKINKFIDEIPESYEQDKYHKFMIYGDLRLG